jgi:ABC-2 type transport system ATP-binding protein
VVEELSVWFGPKVALSELSCSFGPGVTGLLGPNGAGKTTLLRAMTGLIGVSQGAVRLEGRDPRHDRGVHGRVALVPEDEAVPAGLTARQFVRYVADLNSVADRGAPDAALSAVGMLDDADRRVDGFSKGMRQRTKVAAALVKDPQILVLDEPLNGADPVQRVHLIALFKELGSSGRTVIISSHVLNEVERLAERVIVLIHGRLAAAGSYHAIRDAMDDRPRHVLVRTDDPRTLAAALVGLEAVCVDPADGGAGARRLVGEPVPGAGSMTATTHPSAARPRSRFLAIVRFTLQSCLPVRRWVGVLLPCLGALLFALLSRVADDSGRNAFVHVAAEGIFSLLMPIAALVIGDAILGAEVRAGTFHFTWLSPTPFWQMIVGRWLAGSAVALVTIAPACALAAVVAGFPEMAGAAYLAGAAGSIAYIALFIAVASVTRRTAVWSLAIVFLVERLLGAALSGIAQVSPTWLSRAVFIGNLDDPPRRLVREGVPQGNDAVVRLAIVTAVSLLVAVWRVRRMRLSGATD